MSSLLDEHRQDVNACVCDNCASGHSREIVMGTLELKKSSGNFPYCLDKISSYFPSHHNR